MVHSKDYVHFLLFPLLTLLGLQSVLSTISKHSVSLWTAILLFILYHVSSVIKASYFHLWSLPHISFLFSHDMANAVTVSLIQSRLDCANFALYGKSNTNLHQLQQVQNTAARTVSEVFSHWQLIIASVVQPMLATSTSAHSI